jgi:3-dehydroquinate synthetase
VTSARVYLINYVKTVSQYFYVIVYTITLPEGEKKKTREGVMMVWQVLVSVWMKGRKAAAFMR